MHEREFEEIFQGLCKSSNLAEESESSEWGLGETVVWEVDLAVVEAKQFFFYYRQAIAAHNYSRSEQHV